MTTTRLAITGANGFVGRHLTSFASGRRWDVQGVVRSLAGEEIVRHAGGRPFVVPALDADALVPAFAGAAAVVHLAGISAERGGTTYDVANIAGTRAVIEAARRARVPRIVFFSGLGVAHYGSARRCTNGYFLAKMACEGELFRSSLEAVCLRPSYIIGAGSELIPGLVAEMAGGEVELVGDGAYRLQPIAVKDAADLVMACAARTDVRHLVVDMVGPEPLSYAAFLERVAASARRHSRSADYRLRSVSVEEADRQAATGGYRGLLPDELDVLLCDEVADARGAEAVLGRSLTPLDEAIDVAVRGVR